MLSRKECGYLLPEKLLVRGGDTLPPEPSNHTLSLVIILIMILSNYRQIKHLEQLLQEHLPSLGSSANETDPDLRFEGCDIANQPLLQKLRQMIERKDQEIKSLKDKIEEMDIFSQVKCAMLKSFRYSK